jgi:phosphate butyryltransferase
MIRNFDQLLQMLKEQPVRRKIAVVCSQDTHTMQAVLRAYGDGLVEPILLGDREKTVEVLRELHGEELIPRIEDYEDPTDCAKRACELARSGEIDCIMKGRIETGALMKVLVNKEMGIRKSHVMSLIAMMESPNYHKVFAITDPALLVHPDLDQKRAEIVNAVGALHALGIEKPKVAILAAVEKVNPKMQETVDADTIRKEGIEGAIVEGPISYDLAMDPEAAKIKGYESPVAGDADLLVVPDLVSGNIAAKSITVLGGGRTGGTVLGGIVPVLLVSRAASADDKFLSIVVSALIGRQ